MNAQEISHSRLVSQARRGDKTIYLDYAVDSFIQTDTYYLLASLDIQYYGFPPNTDRFEFVRVIDIDRRNNSVTLENALQYTHRSDFPDGANTLSCGRARLWQLNTDEKAWNIDHTYKYLEIRPCLGSRLTYLTATGMTLKFVECVLPGISQSVAQSVSIIGGKLLSQSEPDKLVERCVYRDVDMLNASFQSSSIDTVTIDGCTIRGELNTGTAKYISVTNSTINSLDTYANFGANRFTSISNSIVNQYKYRNRYALDTPQTEIGMGHFENGTFHLPKIPSAISHWNVIPGMCLYLCGPHDEFYGDDSAGIVRRLYETEEEMHIETTLPFATLPHWASGRVRIIRGGDFVVRDCTGCDSIRAASVATNAGKREWEFHRYLLAIHKPKSGYWLGHVGQLTRMSVNVLTPCAGKDSMFILTQHKARLAGPFAEDWLLELSIDLTVSGRRDFNGTTFMSISPNDRLSFGKSVNTIRTPIWFSGSTTHWAFRDTGSEPHMSSHLVVEFEFELGLFRRQLPPLLDDSGNSLIDIPDGIF